MSEEKVLKGTTTVGVCFDKGVVLAADKRATMGNFIAAKEVEKIHLVGESKAITLAGSVGDAQSIVRLMRAEIELYRYSKGKEISVEGVATLLSNVLQGTKYYPYLVQLIVAGFDSEPRLYDLDLTGGMIPEKYVSTGSGSVTAYGLLDEGFKNGLSEQEATRLAVKAVNAAMKRDSATGEGIDVMVLMRKNTKRLSKEDVKAFLS